VLLQNNQITPFCT